MAAHFRCGNTRCDLMSTGCLDPNSKVKKSIKEIDKNIQVLTLNGLGKKYKLNPRHRLFRRELAQHIAEIKSCQSPKENTLPKAELFERLFYFVYKRAWRDVQALHNTKQTNNPLTSNRVTYIFVKIIPKTLFGNTKNKLLFLRIVNISLSRSRNEFIYEDCLTAGYSTDVIPWLPQSVDGEKQKELLCFGIKLIFAHIVLPTVHKLLASEVGHAYELKYFPRQLYNQAITRTVIEMQRRGFISRDSRRSSQKLKTVNLYFKPKTRDLRNTGIDSFRIIGRAAKWYEDSKQVRHINSRLQTVAQEATFVKTTGFFDQYKEFITAHGNRQIFVVKLDFSDCFGNININLLKLIILGSTLPLDIKDTLIKIIMNQYVAFGYTRKSGTKVPIVWRWNHGLIQGMRFSSGLCKLYLANQESVYFEEFNKPNCFIYRQVDDYFFASTRADDVRRFVEIAKSRFLINENKTRSNIVGKRNILIPFCGLVFDTRNGRISCDFSNCSELHNQFRFLNNARPIDRAGVLDRAMYFPYNNYYFQPALMDVALNGPKQVQQNYFESMVFMAFKLDAALRNVNCGIFKPCHEEKTYKTTMQVVNNYAKLVVRQNLKANPDMDKDPKLNNLTNKLKYIGLRAFELVFRKCAYQIYLNIARTIKEQWKRDNRREERYIQNIVRDYNRIPQALKHINPGRSLKILGYEDIASQVPLPSLKK